MQKTDKLPVTFAKNDVEIIARETLYSGFFNGSLPFPAPPLQRRNEW